MNLASEEDMNLGAMDGIPWALPISYVGHSPLHAMVLGGRGQGHGKVTGSTLVKRSIPL